MPSADVKQQRGQFFTTNPRVQSVLVRLLENSGSLLEPSAGAGDLLLAAEQLHQHTSFTGVELDNSIPKRCSTPIQYGDFFTFAADKAGQYDSILGNPPFVAWKAVEDSTRETALSVKQRYSDKTNLYHLFIDRCIDLLAPGGELVFIVPKEWLYTTSATPLREKVFNAGLLTHLVDCGEEKLFLDADVPALIIFRFVKTRPSERSVAYAATLDDALNNNWETRTLTSTADHRFALLPTSLAETMQHWQPLHTQYSVKVGIVSGADKVFRIPTGNPDNIEASSIQTYITTKGEEQFLDLNDCDDYNTIPPHTQTFLAAHKDELLRRKIAHFDETNYWKYGAIRNKNAMLSNTPRFYTLVKTRNAEPFFLNDNVRLFSGGVLGVFQKPGATLSPEVAVKLLNSPKYRIVMESMFLTAGNKVSLQPATLEDVLIPTTDPEAERWLAD